MRFLESSNHASTLAHFFIIEVASVLFMMGCATPSGRFCADPPEIAADQHRTRTAYRNYCQSGLLRDWQAVMNASDTAEIPASRVFRAFTQFSLGGTPNTRKLAEQELVRNPHLSLSILKPLVYERNESRVVTDAMEDLPAFRDKMRDLYVALCQRVAEAESDGFAAQLLSSLTNAPSQRVAKQARQALGQISRENCYLKSQHYKATKNEQDLRWVATRCLRTNMTRKEIESLLGGSDSMSATVQIFHCNSDYRLKVFFRDDAVERWEWVILGDDSHR